jgi:hypothetical protein
VGNGDGDRRTDHFRQRANLPAGSEMDRSIIEIEIDHGAPSNGPELLGCGINNGIPALNNTVIRM